MSSGLHMKLLLQLVHLRRALLNSWSLLLRSRAFDFVPRAKCLVNKIFALQQVQL
jgi:hypothetical protein